MSHTTTSPLAGFIYQVLRDYAPFGRFNDLEQDKLVLNIQGWGYHHIVFARQIFEVWGINADEIEAPLISKILADAKVSTAQMEDLLKSEKVCWEGKEKGSTLRLSNVVMGTYSESLAQHLIQAWATLKEENNE